MSDGGGVGECIARDLLVDHAAGKVGDPGLSLQIQEHLDRCALCAEEFSEIQTSLEDYASFSRR